MAHTILFHEINDKRIMFGIEQIKEVLIKCNMTYEVAAIPEEPDQYRQYHSNKIYVGIRKKDKFLSWLEEQELLLYQRKEPEEEGYCIESIPGNLTVIAGNDSTGALYGCMTLKKLILETGEIPIDLVYSDGPVFKLRGPCVGLQKTKLEPPRLTYEYPITPDRFPWFYNRDMWTQFMDLMLEERCNVLYIWSGHPFSSLVKVKEYPEALEVTEDEFSKNVEIFQWLTEECDKRGIWVVLKFYNIHIPYPFAVKHNLEKKQSRIHPLVADYTTKAIIEFIKAFPHIGLMVCLGEALRGTKNKTDWFVDTIIPAINQGIKDAGIEEEPPVILRGHDCDPIAAMEGAKKAYSNLYTMWKYNGESLTTYFPRGSWQETHKDLSRLGTTHIMNVHILANLEPFRYQAPEFILRCCQAGQYRLGCNGLHLYPLFYWDWPYTPDKATPRLLQLERDWIWYKAWFRYAWNPDRDERDEKLYWINELMTHFLCNEHVANVLLESMNHTGYCTPKLLGRIGITEGNRQTMSLGMTMSELTNVMRYRPNLELWNSVARKGEQLEEYVQKELAGISHVGETPMDMIDEVEYHAKKAWELTGLIRECMQDNIEIQRICQDIEANYYLSMFYCKKVLGAIKILEYKHTIDFYRRGNIILLEEACEWMEESLLYYRKLTELTNETYFFANSMQTPQRKLPFEDGGIYDHWSKCLPLYEQEYVNMKRHIENMKAGIYPDNHIDTSTKTAERLQTAEFELLSENCELYKVEEGSSLFIDSVFNIIDVVPELNHMTGIRMKLNEAIEDGTLLKINLKEDAQILIGYLMEDDYRWLKVPVLETDTHADDRGGLSPICIKGVSARNCPAVNIHAFRYEKGYHEIYLGTGGYTVLGVVSANSVMSFRTENIRQESLDKLDWLFEK